jgi:8-oxo-dGTP diphosphatase
MGMKQIEVVAAVIREGNAIFATQRGYGEFEGMWEFPGGKIEAGETPEVALMREIREELNVEISVGNLLTTIRYDYPSFLLLMHCYWCQITKGTPQLLEHKSAQWLTESELTSVAWLPADIEVVSLIQKELTKKII